MKKVKISYLPIREFGINGIRKLREREIVQSVIRSVNQWMYSEMKEEEDFQEHQKVAFKNREGFIE